MSELRLSVSDQIIDRCVGLLLMPDVYGDPEWRKIILNELRAALPKGSVTHPHVGPLIREAGRCWGAGLPEAHLIPRVRAAWVALGKWRLGQALDHVRKDAA